MAFTGHGHVTKSHDTAFRAITIPDSPCRDESCHWEDMIWRWDDSCTFLEGLPLV